MDRPFSLVLAVLGMTSVIALWLVVMWLAEDQ
jgi:hypothetical protein